MDKGGKSVIDLLLKRLYKSKAVCCALYNFSSLFL